MKHKREKVAGKPVEYREPCEPKELVKFETGKRHRFRLVEDEDGNVHMVPVSDDEPEPKPTGTLTVTGVNTETGVITLRSGKR